jgi:hypothetical protein
MKITGVTEAIVSIFGSHILGPIWRFVAQILTLTVHLACQVFVSIQCDINHERLPHIKVLNGSKGGSFCGSLMRVILSKIH